MPEGTFLGPEMGFKPETTEGEYRAQSQKAFEAVVAQAGLPEINRARLGEVFNLAQDAFIKDPQVNLLGRQILRDGLRLGRMGEDGAGKEEKGELRMRLQRRCGELVRALDTHGISALPSQKEIAGLVVKMALAIQEAKRNGATDQSFVLRQGITNVLPRQEGKISPAVAIGAAGIVTIACVLALAVESVGFGGKHFDQLKAGAKPKESVSVRELQQEDFSGLLGMIDFVAQKEVLPDGQSSLAEYYKQVWGIDVFAEIQPWLENNPKATQEQKSEFVDKLLSNRRPAYAKGYKQWLEEKWYPSRPQKQVVPTITPQPTPTRLSEFQSEKAKLAVNPRFPGKRG